MKDVYTIYVCYSTTMSYRTEFPSEAVVTVNDNQLAKTIFAGSRTVTRATGPKH